MKSSLFTKNFAKIIISIVLCAVLVPVSVHAASTRSFLSSLYCKTVGSWIQDISCLDIAPVATDIPVIETPIKTTQIPPYVPPATIETVSNSPKQVPNTPAIRVVSNAAPTVTPSTQNQINISHIDTSNFVTYDSLGRQVDSISNSIAHAMDNLSATLNSRIDGINTGGGGGGITDLSSFTTANLTEGSNLYFTNARVGSYISSSSTVPHVGGSTYGDVLFWNGSTWSTIATSSLGITGGSYTNSDTNTFINASTTIPKTYTANIFTGSQTFNGGITLGSALTVANGGTGASTFGQGWIFSNGGTGALSASTSPTVNYITATSTTATSTFANGINLSGGCFSIGGVCLASSTYGDTNVNSYIHASSTIPKTYTANAWSALQQFNANASTTQFTSTGSVYLATTGGNVGIGTTSPYSKLSVTGDSAFNGNLLVTGTTTANGFVLNSNKTFYIGTDVLIDSNGNLNATILPLQDTASNLSSVVPQSGEFVYETDTATSKVGNGITSVGNLTPLMSGVLGSSPQYQLAYFASSTGKTLAGTSTLTVKNERLGIKNSNPFYALDVNGTIGSPISTDLNIYAGDSGGQGVSSNLNLYAHDNDNASIRLDATDAITILSGGIANNPLSITANGDIGAGGDGIILGQTGSGDIRLYTTSGNIRLDPAGGNVGIATGTPWKTFSVNGTVAFSGLSTSAVGNAICITAGKEITTANTSACLGVSSQRFKHDILDTDLGLDTVLALRPVSFKYNDGYGDSGKDTQYGLIAEEAYAVNHKLAVLDTMGIPTTVRYDFLPAILIKAVKQLNDLVGALTIKVNSILAWFNDGKLTVQNDICVDNVCVNKNQFKALLLQAGGTMGGTPSSVQSPSPVMTPPDATASTTTAPNSGSQDQATTTEITVIPSQASTTPSQPTEPVPVEPTPLPSETSPVPAGSSENP